MEGEQSIGTIRLQNILSYGPDTPTFDLKPLNVLIGPNASGKSNLIEALSILAAAPKDIQAPLRQGGGVREWIWKGSSHTPTASIEATVQYLPASFLRYRLSFTADEQARFKLHDEVIEDKGPSMSDSEPSLLYQHEGYQPETKNLRDIGFEKRSMPDKVVKPDQSILSQWPDPTANFQLMLLSVAFNEMRFYREFPLERSAPVRLPQQADLPQDYLWEDGSNFAVVLSLLLNQPHSKEWLLQNLQEFYPSVRDIQAVVIGGSVQVSFHEEDLGHPVPATRLSDGTLRYLFLLAALCNPEPPPVICIEEPETGLHPDVLPKLAELLVEASKRSQIIVTTHSDILVDALSDTPEAIVICEKVDGATQLRRLDPDELKIWLEKYRLGELWTSGELGGNLY